MNALRIVLLALAVAVLGLVGWRSVGIRPAVVAGPRGDIAALEGAMLAPAPPLRAAPRQPSPEDRLAEAPEFAPFYGRLKADFPRAYSAVLERVGEGSPSANAAIWEALRDLQQSRGILAAQADASALGRFFDARSAMLAGLAPLNARQCVDFLYGVTDPSIAEFTASHRGLVATLAERTLDAIADGRRRPAERVAPTAADLESLSRGLAARGLTPSEVGLLLDGTTPDPPLPDRRVCEVGRTYLDVLRELPADARHRVYGLAAELLARS